MRLKGRSVSMVQEQEVIRGKRIVKEWFASFGRKYDLSVKNHISKTEINGKVIGVRGAKSGASGGKFGLRGTHLEDFDFFLFIIPKSSQPNQMDDLQFVFLTQDQTADLKERLGPNNNNFQLSNFYEFQSLQGLEKELCHHFNRYCLVPEEWELEQLHREDGMTYGDEGIRKLIKHYKIERNHKVVKAAKENRLLETGVLACEICDFAYPDHYGDVGEGYIEAHHKVPLNQSDGEGVQTTTADLALLCANCHRMIHRKMREFPDHSYDQLQKILYQPREIRY